MRLQNGRRNISPNRKSHNKMIQEYVEKKYGFKVHTAYVAEVKRDENIYQITEQIVQLHQKAYEVYLPLVEDVCSRTVSEDENNYLADFS